MTDFKKYNSIENPSQVVEKFYQYGYGKKAWLGFEKVHGSNYQFTWENCDPDILRTGRRNSILGIDEKFTSYMMEVARTFDR